MAKETFARCLVEKNHKNIYPDSPHRSTLFDFSCRRGERGHRVDGFAQFGILIAWTLPDMGSTFLSFIELLQIVLVAAFGLLLTGLIALIAKLTPTR